MKKILLSQTKGRWTYGSTPSEILKNVKNKADPTKMIETSLDDNLNTQSEAFGETNRIANTLDQVRENLDPFIQWMVFIGLTFAVILIIRNAFGLSTSGVTWDDTASKDIKNKIYNIIKWVVIITAAFWIIKLLLGAISYILN